MQGVYGGGAEGGGDCCATGWERRKVSRQEKVSSDIKSNVTRSKRAKEGMEYSNEKLIINVQLLDDTTCDRVFRWKGAEE